MLASILIACTACGAYPHECRAAREYKAAVAVDGIKFLDFGQWQGDERDELTESTSFWLPHLTLNPLLDHSRHQRLPGTDLGIIDIDKLQWGIKTWCEVAKFYPYGVYVDQHGQLRRDYNPLILRADWLLADTADNQRSKGKTYLRLLYAGKKIPATVQEFHAALGVDFKATKDINAGVVIEAGRSGVASNRRLIVWDDVAGGSHYQTFDSAEPIGVKDPLQTYHPHLRSDAQEFIKAIPKVGIDPPFRGIALAYFLAEKDKRVDVAATNVVQDRNSFRGNPAIILPGGCVGCHQAFNGPKQNLLREFLASGVRVGFKSIEEEIFTDRFFLSDDPIKNAGAVAEAVAADNLLFQKFVHAACGDDVDVGDVTADWRRSIERYDLPLDLEQAALECASTADELRFAIGYYSRKYGGATNLVNLNGLGQGNPVDRLVFEQEVYGQALLALWHWRKK